MAEYPSSVYSPRTKENKSGVVYDAAKKTILFAEDVTKLDDEIVAIETKLGITDAVINKCGGIKPDSDSETAIQLQNAAGTTILNIDTTNKKVKINGILEIEGSYNSQLDLYEAGTLGARIYWAKDTQQLILYNAKASGADAIKTADPLYVDGQLTINNDVLSLLTSKTPASAGAAGTAGDICWDAGFLYVCTATDTWKKIAIATW